MRLPEAFNVRRLVCGALLLATFSACKSPREKVREGMKDLKRDWSSNVVHQSDLPVKELDWPTALDLMRANNPKLKQSRTELTNSVEAVRQIWRELMPSLNLRSGLSKSLESLGSTTFSDVTFSADSFFNIPGMVNFGARLYAAKLFRYRAETSFDLAEREQTIALYKLFLAALDAEAEQERFAREKTTAQAVGQIDPFSGRMMQTEAELQELGGSKQLQSVQDQAGDLFGSRAFRWKFTTNGLPELNYESNPLILTDTNRVAQLQMRLVAIEYAAAKAQLQGIKLRYWPDLNLYISGPPIYSRRAGQDVFWDAAQVRASADLFWNIDTKGYVGRQLRLTRRSQQLQREAFELQAVALIDRLLFTQKLLAASREKEKQLDLQLRVLLAVPPAQTYFSLEKYASDYRSLVDNRRRLRRELAELETLFWFVDDTAWPGQKTTEQLSEAARAELAEPASHDLLTAKK